MDLMLSLGREVLAEPNTSSTTEGLMQKLTSFIKEWSDLQLGWQNWFDELHAGVEQSRNLSDQLKKFESDIKGLEPTCSMIFPAVVSMKNLDKELDRIHVCVCVCACVGLFVPSMWWKSLDHLFLVSS